MRVLDFAGTVEMADDPAEGHEDAVEVATVHAVMYAVHCFLHLE